MVTLLLADGFEEVEAISVIDYLRRANIDIYSVSISDQKLVKGAHSIYVQSDKVFNEINFDDVEMIILPGGEVGANNLSDSVDVINTLKKFNEQNKYIAAICASPAVVLKNNNLLGEKKVLCYKDKDLFEIVGSNLYEDFDNVNSLVDKNIITSKSPNTADAFALKIIEVLKGKDIKKSVSDDINCLN